MARPSVGRGRERGVALGEVVLEVGDGHLAGDAPLGPARERDGEDLELERLARAAREQGEGREVRGPGARRHEVVDREVGALEELVEEGDRPGLGGDPRRDALDVLQDRGAGRVALSGEGGVGEAAGGGGVHGATTRTMPERTTSRQGCAHAGRARVPATAPRRARGGTPGAGAGPGARTPPRGMQAGLWRAPGGAQTAPMLIVLIAIPLLLIWVLAVVDLVRRHDLTTGHKVLWALAVLLVPIVGAIVYFVVRPPEPTDRFGAPSELAHESTPGVERVRDRHPF